MTAITNAISRDITRERTVGTQPLNTNSSIIGAITMTQNDKAIVSSTLRDGLSDASSPYDKCQRHDVTTPSNPNETAKLKPRIVIGACGRANIANREDNHVLSVRKVRPTPASHPIRPHPSNSTLAPIANTHANDHRIIKPTEPARDTICDSEEKNERFAEAILSRVVMKGENDNKADRKISLKNFNQLDNLF